MFDFTTLLTVATEILPTPPSGTPQSIASQGIEFFSTWIARIGGFVAFIGAIKFALSIKVEEAQEKIQAVLIMVSGFMIVAAVNGDDLNLFQFGMDLDAQFTELMTFIGAWVATVGALVVLLGSVMFGFSIKDNNATGKISGLKTIAAGAITTSVAIMLPQFV